jgi:hypothetical protein
MGLFLLLSMWTLASCSVEESQQKTSELGQSDIETSIPRQIETLLVDYDKGGRSRQEALESLKGFGDAAIVELQLRVLPRNGPRVRLMAIEILAKLQGYSEESVETVALVMQTVGDWDFQELPLNEVCAALKAASGVSFHLSESLNPQLKMSIKFREGRLNTMLHLMLRPHGMTFMIKGKEVWIY